MLQQAADLNVVLLYDLLDPFSQPTWVDFRWTEIPLSTTTTSNNPTCPRCLTDWFGQGKSWPTRDPAPSDKPSLEAGFEWGFGPKASPGYECLRYSSDEWSAQLEHFLETQLHAHADDETGAPAKAVLVGNSLGGLVAANLAATRPDLVEGLVFLNATPFWGANRRGSPVWQGDLPIPKPIQVCTRPTQLLLRPARWWMAACPYVGVRWIIAPSGDH